MKTFEKMAAQGDMILRVIDKLPEDIEEVTAEQGEFVLAHSETGHNHVVKKQKGVTMYANKNNPFIAYLVVDNSAKTVLLEHKRSYDTHETIMLKDKKNFTKDYKRVYEIRRQREYTPEGFRRAQD